MLTSDVWKEMESFESKDLDDDGYEMSAWPYVPRRKVFVYKFELGEAEGTVVCFEVDDRGRHGVMTYRNPFSVVADACWLVPCGLDARIVRGYLSPVARPTDETFRADVILMPDRETSLRKALPRLRVCTLVLRFSEPGDAGKTARRDAERLCEVHVLLSVLGVGRLWALTLSPESERVRRYCDATELSLWDRPKREAFLVSIALLELLCQLDPDAIAGWNLAHRFREMEEAFGGHVTALLRRLSRVPGRRATFERLAVRERLLVPGRIVVDPWVRFSCGGVADSGAEKALERALEKERKRSSKRGVEIVNRAHLLWNHVRRKAGPEAFCLGEQRLPSDVSLALLAAYSA